MSEFLVEFYVPESDVEAVERGAQRARAAAEELSAQGTPVRYLRSIFVPEDETCFYVYEAASSDAVCEAAARAGIEFEHVAEAFIDATAETSPRAPATREPNDGIRRR